MLLAFCIYKYFPYGGLQRDFMQVVNACKAQGHNIRIYTLAWQGIKPLDVDLILVPTKGWSNHARHQHYHNWVTSHLKKYPVDKRIGFNKMPNLDVYFAGDTCFAEKAAHKNLFYRLTKRCKHYLTFEESVFSKASSTQIMVLTKQQIDDFQKYYQTADDRFQLLPPGIAINRKHHANSHLIRKSFRHANQILDDQFVILQIGSDFKRKGVDRALYAIAALPDELKQKVVYLVVGQDNAASYQKLAAQLNITNQVRFYSGRNDIDEFLFAADLLVHAARQEAAGMVLVEALAAGLAVIVSEVSGYAYHVKDANAGIILAEPYQQQDFNKALTMAMVDKQQLTEWQNNAIYYGDSQDLYDLAQHATDIILKDR